MLGILLVLAQATVGETPDRMRHQLQQATSATGADYFAARSNLVALGSNAVPQFSEISANSNESWQVRLMAGIIAERIQRGAEITALIEKDWRDDPEYNPDWDKYHGGPASELWPLVVKRFRVKALWWYYVELTWKDTEEHPATVQVSEDCWRGWGSAACEGSPVYNLLVEVLAERIRGDIGFKKYERWGEFNFLIQSKTNTALPFLLEIIPLVPLNNRDGAFYKVLKNMAQPTDVPLIEKHFHDKGQEIPVMLREPLNALKRPAVAGEGHR